MADNGTSGELHIGKASIVAVIGLLLGIFSSIIYLGGSLRQIDVNTLRINDLEEHGSPALRAIELKIKDLEKRDEAMQGEFRPREFWENLAVQLATLKTRLDYRECDTK